VTLNFLQMQPSFHHTFNILTGLVNNTTDCTLPRHSGGRSWSVSHFYESLQSHIHIHFLHIAPSFFIFCTHTFTSTSHIVHTLFDHCSFSQSHPLTSFKPDPNLFSHFGQTWFHQTFFHPST